MHLLKTLFKPFHKKKSLTVVYVEYDRHKNKSSDEVFKTLQSYLQKIRGCRITYLRVDNKFENKGIEQVAANIYTVGGDNSFREFSGWQKGIDAIKSLSINSEVVLISNEMFLKPGPSFLQDYSSKEILERCITANKVIGRIDSTNQPYKVFGYDVSSWVCTNAVLAPQKAFDELKSVVLINDNIHEILKEQYDSNHLLYNAPLPDNNSESNTFTIDINFKDRGSKEIRCKISPGIQDNKNLSNSNLPLEIILTDLLFDGAPCPERTLIRGFSDKEGLRAISDSFLISLPQHPGKLEIKGFVPQELIQKNPPSPLHISVYNDSLLFAQDTSMNTIYQRGLIEWLTERWHSKFDIQADTWELFKTKTAAIINESLLTAKLSELGYNPESYGEKTYY